MKKNKARENFMVEAEKLAGNYDKRLRDHISNTNNRFMEEVWKLAIKHAKTIERIEKECKDAKK